MIINRNILIENLITELPSILILLVGIVMLLMFLSDLSMIKKGITVIKDKREHKIRSMCTLIFSIIFIIVFILNFGIIFVQMGWDYYNNDFSYYEGYILHSAGANGITGTKINIQGSTFFLIDEYEDILKYHISDYCKIIYGTHSKFIVDYTLIEK